jgi:hypothetical protein
MKNAVFWDLAQPSAHAGSSLPKFYILKMEAIRSSEKSVKTSQKMAFLNSVKVPFNTNIFASHHILFFLFVVFKHPSVNDLISETRKQLPCGHPPRTTELDSKIK